VTTITPSFKKISRGYVRTICGNMRVKFQVRTGYSFNRFAAVGILTPKLLWLAGPLRTGRQTDIERKRVSAIHSIHLAEIISSWCWVH